MIYKKILLAVDGSEYSIRAAKEGLALAHQLNAEVNIVFVLDSGEAMGNVDAGISREEALIILKKEAEETIAGLIEMYDGNVINKFMPEGNPKVEIIKMAELLDVDLIVMGTHGRTGLERLLVGSIAENIIRKSKIPVLVVPSK